MYSQASDYKQSGTLLFFLVVVFLITYLILTFYSPDFVQRKEHGHATGENDQAVTMLWALAITVLILIVLGLLWYGFGCYY